MVVSYRVGSGNQTHSLQKSSQGLKLLGHLQAIFLLNIWYVPHFVNKTKYKFLFQNCFATDVHFIKQLIHSLLIKFHLSEK